MTRKALSLLLALTLPTTRALLKLMGTPEEQMGYAYDYIFIIFIGIPATILYNMGACVLRSLGDSKSPVWFLAIASVINIVLDLLTVCVLGMGVAGAAIALLGGFLGLERLDMRGMLILIAFLLLVVQTLHSMERGLTAVGDAAALVWKRLPRKSKAEENY